MFMPISRHPRRIYENRYDKENKHKIRDDLIRVKKTQAFPVVTLYNREMVKLIRAQGGCLGTKSRRKT